MINTDILIIGAGPTGLFTVFEAGLLRLKCHLIDSLPIPGGQCAEIYPKKPIYDIPSHPEILAGDLVSNLMQQIKPFQPGFSFGECAIKMKKKSKQEFIVETDKGSIIKASVIVIAGGLGSFEPRKPPVNNLVYFENKGVDYIIKDPKKYKNKKIVIAGGGDSALDWTIFLSKITNDLTLIHRRKEFRGSIDSVNKVQKLKTKNKINLITPAEIISISGKKKLEEITVLKDEKEISLSADFFIPLFGLKPNLGPLKEWGLELENNSIKVNNALDYQTNIPGIYAVGDVNTYPGKLKLILCGFHEATLMCQSAFKRIYPEKRNVLKYTTVSGIDGFDGSRKEADKFTIKTID
jgi:thioredoxin reductase (NADPH)